MRACPWVSSSARRSEFHRKRAEIAQLNPIAAGERHDDLAENRPDEFLDVTLVEVWVFVKPDAEQALI